MASSATRWNLVVAVQARVWELTIEQVKANNSGRSQDEIESIIAESLAWARHR